MYEEEIMYHKAQISKNKKLVKEHDKELTKLLKKRAERMQKKK